MKKSIKKTTSVIMVVILVAMSLITSISVNAVDENKVRVVIENNVFSVDKGAAWDGVLVDQLVNIDDASTMMSAVVDALDNNGYTQEGADNNYITSVNGLSAYDAGSMSGWVSTLNDWFTNESSSAYNVESGTLENGDEIKVIYSLSYGEDAGSIWNSTDTALADLSFSCGMLSKEFSSTTMEYTLTLPSDTTSVKVIPTAINKNYQVRTYKNEYTPNVENSEYKRSAQIDVAHGDTIFVGVGNSNWPTMNSIADETIYIINLKIENKAVLGDINGDGTVNVTDCTIVQKHLAGLAVLTQSQLKSADINKDENVDVTDITSMQKIISNKK